MLNRPIFIVGCHKSGSSLLRSLLDGHPELFVIPTEIHFFQYTGYWVDYRLRYAWPRKMGRREVIDSLVNLIQEKNTHQDPYADSNISGKINVKIFQEYLESQDFSDSPVQLYSSYIEALYLALYGYEMPLQLRSLEKSVENAEFAFLLRNMFPDCLFIHIVRNPYASLVAIRKSKTRNDYPYLRDYILSIQNSFRYLFLNQSVLDGYLVVEYEKLLQDTCMVMNKIADFAKIPFTESLLSPTLMNQAWGGNSTTGKKFEKISTKPLTIWQSQINDFEIELVNSFLGPIVNQLGYQPMKAKGGKFFPMRNEKIRTYLKNRSLFWFKPIPSESP